MYKYPGIDFSSHTWAYFLANSLRLLSAQPGQVTQVTTGICENESVAFVCCYGVSALPEGN